MRMGCDAFIELEHISVHRTPRSRIHNTLHAAHRIQLRMTNMKKKKKINTSKRRIRQKMYNANLKYIADGLKHVCVVHIYTYIVSFYIRIMCGARCMPMHISPDGHHIERKPAAGHIQWHCGGKNRPQHSHVLPPWSWCMFLCVRCTMDLYRHCILAPVCSSTYYNNR